MALLGSPRSTPLSVSVQPPLSSSRTEVRSAVGWKMSVALDSVVPLRLLKCMEFTSSVPRSALSLFWVAPSSACPLLLRSDVNTDPRRLFFYVCLCSGLSRVGRSERLASRSVGRVGWSCVQFFCCRASPPLDVGRIRFGSEI